MWPFRRRDDETLNDQLLREAGLDDDQPDDEPEARPLAIRPDAVVTADAQGIAGDTVAFVVLPEGDLVAEEDGNADDELLALADAVERRIRAPYRVRGRRGEGDAWELLVYRLDVRGIAYRGADELELVRRDGEAELRADGDPADGSIRALEEAGEAVGTDYVVHAERLDGDMWEIRAAAL